MKMKMKIFACTLLCMFIVIGDSRELNSKSSMKGKIINGLINMQNCLDYIASLKRLPDEHYCSGVVITSFHVLTAAYCLYPYKNQYLFGRIFVIIGYIEHSISGMQYHSEYRFSKDDNDRVNSTNFDIGLITLTVSTNVEPVALTEPMESNVAPDDYVVMAGYSEEYEYSAIKMKIVLDKIFCREAYINNRGEDRLFCARPMLENGIITETDIGSPIFRWRKLLGVVSGGYLNTVKPYVAITSIPAHLSYILKRIEECVD